MSRPQPLVSLIMAAYNNVAYIKLAIDSVKAQTYQNWELIIYDDGSTDGTCELAKALAQTDARIKFHAAPVNEGYNLTMVKLSKLVTGEFITHFDSDDMLERWSVEEMVRAFEIYPQAHLIYADMAQIDVKGNVTHYTLNSDFDPEKLYNYGWKAMGMYRSSVLKEIHGYNEKLSIVSGCIDGDLFMQIAEKKFTIVHYPKVLYLYRYHGNHTSSKKLKCEECPANPNCNYIRVWAKSLNYDQRTLTPLA
jgi:glycosyltransferase involved in cell wall biosynthesis